MSEIINNEHHVPLPNALIKIGRKEYMHKFLEEGECRFSVASTFQNMSEKENDIADRYEGKLFYNVKDLYVARILEDGQQFITEKPIKLSDNTEIQITNSVAAKIPFSCYYSYTKSPMNALVKLDNYDEIVKGMGDEYDTAVIIYNPLKFIEQINKIYSVYCNNVIYCDRTPSEREIENTIHYLFYKRTKYSEQREFRIALPTLSWDKADNINIGSILDIAYSVPLKSLKYGIVIAESKEKFDELSKILESKLKMKIGESHHLFDPRLK